MGDAALVNFQFLILNRMPRSRNTCHHVGPEEVAVTAGKVAFYTAKHLYYSKTSLIDRLQRSIRDRPFPYIDRFIWVKLIVHTKPL